MEFLQAYHDWAKGELLQAKIMLFMGTIILIYLIFSFRNSGQVLSGLTIPLALTVVALIGYGGFIVTDRNKRLTKIEMEFNKEVSLTTKEEKRKIEEGITTCNITIKIWGAITVVGIVLFFWFSNSYYKGIATGITILGLTLLLIDVFVDKRAKKLLPDFDNIELIKSE